LLLVYKYSSTHWLPCLFDYTLPLLLLGGVCCWCSVVVVVILLLLLRAVLVLLLHIHNPNIH
jgi:hypothetical protein